jgi:hypothetical protein
VPDHAWHPLDIDVYQDRRRAIGPMDDVFGRARDQVGTELGPVERPLRGITSAGRPSRNAPSAIASCGAIVAM